jgi:arylsulfatase A-like enzyme
MRRAVALTAALGLALIGAAPHALGSEEASPAARIDEPAAPTQATAAPTEAAAAPTGATATPSEAAAATAPTQPLGLAPDIVLVMVDDLGYLADERILARLPEISELWLEGGLRFERMYDQTPLCSPSRASLLTGKDTLDHGVIRNDPRALEAGETVVAALQEAGYHTFLSGKYLNHYDGSQVPPGWDRSFMLRSETKPSFWRDGRPVSYEGRFRDDVIRQQAVRWLDRAPLDQPVLAWLSVTAPHVCEGVGRQCYQPDVMERDRGAAACASIAPFRPPTYTTDTNPAEVRGMPRWPRGWRLGRACESLLVVDRAVGQLVDAQAARGRPAWFIFVSDNGMSWGQKGFSLKHTPPASHAPFYVAGPGVEPGSTDALSSKIDVAPTIAAMAGLELPWADGMSLLPLLRGETGEGRAELLEVMPGSGAPGYEGWNALRTADHRFIRWDDGRRELYDLASDPWEAHDLVSEEPARAATMEARLDELLAASE